MTEPSFCPLFDPDEIGRFDVAASNIGGKAHSLVLLAKAGMAVPPACVIPIPVCADGFTNGRISESLHCSLQAGIATLEQATGCSFDASTYPLRLAVRSGAAVSMPGTMESILNVGDWPQLLRAVTAVLDSWMSPAAQAFRQARSLTHLTGTALILQQMIETEAAGVTFTQDPTGSRPGMLCIEAIAGLGDRLVSGAETGQRWFVTRDSDDVACEPLKDNVSPLLNIQELMRLKRSALQIESLFQQPVDVEWGRANGDFVFFQARPIVFSTSFTTEKNGLRGVDDSGADQSRAVNHPACEELKTLVERENIRLNGFRAAGDLFWVRHNLCETLPHPTPLTWSIIQQFMKGSGGFGRLYRSLSFAPSRRIRHQGFLELIGGQIYASPARLPELFCVDFPFSFNREELERDSAALDRAPQQLDLDRVGPWFLLRSPWILWVLWRAGRRIRRLRRTVEHSFHETLPLYHAFLDEERSQSLDRLTIPELKAVLQRRIQRVMQEFAPQLMLPGLVGAAVFEMGRRKLAQLSPSLKSDEICQQLLQHLRIPCLEDFLQTLAELKKGELSLPEFLARHGHRADQEMELAEPRWSENPGAAMLRANCFSLTGVSSPAKQDLAALLKAAIPDASGHRSWPELCQLYEDALRLLPYRELGKHEFLQGYALLRNATESLGRATRLGSDVYFLTLGELDLWDQPETKALISVRQRERTLWRDFPCPALLDEQGLKLATQPVDGQMFVLQGTVISSGSAVGTAWLPRLESQEPPVIDAVLVAPSLLPQFVTLFSGIRAIVVDQSALLSHGAILARQFGIPVVCYPQATQLICEGDRIILEGSTGSITVERTSSA